jgi:hypothetical protein
LGVPFVISVFFKLASALEGVKATRRAQWNFTAPEALKVMDAGVPKKGIVLIFEQHPA